MTWFQMEMSNEINSEHLQLVVVNKFHPNIYQWYFLGKTVLVW